MTDNIVKRMNSMLRDVREYAPLSLLNFIVTKLSDWFFKRLEVAANMRGPLTTWAEKRMMKRDELSRMYDIRTLHHYTYEVLDRQKNVIVDLNRKICTCRRFQLDQLLCSHALDVTSKINISKYGMAFSYYMAEHLIKVYVELIFPIGHEDYWNTPEEVSNLSILAPILRRPSGRPKKVRMSSQGEEVLTKKCKKYKKTGYNRRTCKNLPVLDDLL